MTDPFARIPLDSNAVDLAWFHFQAGDLSRFDAAKAMTLAGTTFPEAQALLRSTSMPSTSGALAATL